MHHKIRFVATTLALAVACQALCWPRKPLLAADKPKADPAQAARVKATERFEPVRSYTLICTVHADDEFTFVVGQGQNADTHRLRRRFTTVARIELTDFNKEGNDFYQWSGKGQAHFDAFAEDYVDNSYSANHVIRRGSGSKMTFARFRIDRRTGKYLFYVRSEAVSGPFHTDSHLKNPRAKNGPPHDWTGNLSVEGMDKYFDVERDLPEAGLAVGGDGSLPVQEYLKFNPGMTVEKLHHSVPIQGSMTWELIPKGEEILDLEIIPQTDYREWLPRGDLDDPKKPGNTLKFVAKLSAADGGAVRSKVNQFKFELEKTSREPGVCMNWPPAASADRSFDLQFGFDAASKMLPILEGGGQSIFSVPGPQTSVTVPVNCYDFGAYGYLKGYVLLADRRKVYAHLIHDYVRTRVPIPWREDDSSKVAKYFKDSQNVPSARDEDDDDVAAAGGAHKGDGLSVYEEYRGFSLLNGGKGAPMFFRLNPTKKHLFIRNELGDKGITAGGHYDELTEIRVVVVPEKGHENRVINFNHSGDVPHLCDQHLILLTDKQSADKVKSIPGGTSYQIISKGGAKDPYTPADVQAIVPTWGERQAEKMVESMPDIADEIADIAMTDLVRQLLVATSVRYHGEGDGKMVTWTADRKGDKSIRENGQIIKVFLEHEGAARVDGTDPIFIDGRAHVFLGKQKGFFSGDDQCIMRLTSADAYVSASDPSVRYLLRGHAEKEKTGDSLCTKKDGTGVNDRNARWPRYGDATRGACKLQLNVSDVGK